MRSPQRPHVRDDVSGQQYAAPPGLCSVCPPSCLAYAYITAHRAGPSPTLDGDSDTLQSGDADQTVQGSDPPPPPQFLSCQGALTPCHRSLVGGACPPHEHVLRRLHSLAPETAAGPRTLALDASTSREGARQIRSKRP